MLDALFFSRFNLVFCYRSGSRNGKADTLSLRHDLFESRPHPSIISMFYPAVFPSQSPAPALLSLSSLAQEVSFDMSSPAFYDRLVQATLKDDYAQAKLSDSDSASPTPATSSCSTTRYMFLRPMIVVSLSCVPVMTLPQQAILALPVPSISSSITSGGSALQYSSNPTFFPAILMPVPKRPARSLLASYNLFP